MIVANVGVPSNGPTKAQIHVRGLNALPTGATATLYYAGSTIEVAPKSVSPNHDLIMFEFAVDGPNVTVLGTDNKDHVIAAGDDCFVVMNARQVKIAQATGAIRTFVTDNTGAIVKDLTFVEGNAAAVDPDAKETVYPPPPVAQWNLGYVVDLT